MTKISVDKKHSDSASNWRSAKTMYHSDLESYDKTFMLMKLDVSQYFNEYRFKCLSDVKF